MLARNIRIEDDLVGITYPIPARNGLAGTLWLLAGDANPGRPTACCRGSQETLAEMIGTTRSRVNFFMKKFQKLGFIDSNGGLKSQSVPPDRHRARLAIEPSAVRESRPASNLDHADSSRGALGAMCAGCVPTPLHSSSRQRSVSAAPKPDIWGQMCGGSPPSSAKVIIGNLPRNAANRFGRMISSRRHHTTRETSGLCVVSRERGTA